MRQRICSVVASLTWWCRNMKFLAPSSYELAIALHRAPSSPSISTHHQRVDGRVLYTHPCAYTRQSDRPRLSRDPGIHSENFYTTLVRIGGLSGVRIRVPPRTPVSHLRVRDSPTQ